MFNNLLLSTQDTTGLPYQIRTGANFGALLDAALVLKQPFVIYIDPSRLRFATNPPDVHNFDQIRLDQDFPNRNPNGTTKTAAPASSVPPGYAPTGGINPFVGTMHANTTTIFNLAALPAVVVKQFSDHANPDMILSKSDIKQFSDVASCTDPTDASKTVALNQLRYLDGGYRRIARNGAYFDLNPQGHDGIKQFYGSFPSLADTEIGTVVRWYKLVVQVAATHGIYVHPYECFRSDAYGDNGFTCGDDYFDSSHTRVMCDLPLRFQSSFGSWNQCLSITLNKDSVFPKILCLSADCIW